MSTVTEFSKGLLLCHLKFTSSFHADIYIFFATKINANKCLDYVTFHDQDLK